MTKEITVASLITIGLAIDVDPALAIDRGAVSFGEAVEGVFARHQGSRATGREMPPNPPLARRDGEEARGGGRRRPASG